MPKARDYLTDVKVELLKKDYNIISDDKNYKNMTTNLDFKCVNCETVFQRTPKMALRSYPHCKKCTQKLVTGEKLSKLKFDKNVFLKEYKNTLKNLSHINKDKFRYECSRCNVEVIRIASRIKTTNHPKLCNHCGQGTGSLTKIVSNEYINNWLIKKDSETICVEEDITGNKTPILFKCGCGELFRRKWNVVQCYGFTRCSTCSNKKSSGEVAVEKALIDLGIVFEYQKIFKECKYKLPLPFDFYLEDFNTLIEYDGIQHFRDVRYDGECKEIQMRDRIKNKFCLDNNITLLRIPYTETKNIKKIIINKLYGNTEPSLERNLFEGVTTR